eukprot:TRINITY_DN2962_c0_g1_i1.p1 TRINITY_DN2962_c0_g1~~TRINITY_DN2962_c0_g1_i1.p1  ORF type:complete len:735 (+),score=136.17 TRINITY_DN2962_c0_g1_i1:270-2474(+)
MKKVMRTTTNNTTSGSHTPLMRARQTTPMKTAYLLLLFIYVVSAVVQGYVSSTNENDLGFALENNHNKRDTYPTHNLPPLTINTDIPDPVTPKPVAPTNKTIVCEKTSKGINCNGTEYEKPESTSDQDGPGSPRFFLDLGLCVALTLLAGMMSGLTMGLMSIDTMNLQILINGGGTKTQQRYAKRIYPLVKRHHLLLVTLLVANAAAMEALPIFLDRIVGPIAAILISITCILCFGEVIPQALCTRFGLAIGANLFWLVWIIIIVLFPISWPISLVLDVLLGGEHGTFFRRAELKELVNLHVKERQFGKGGDAEAFEGMLDMGLSADEVSIIHGALDMTIKTVRVPMTPIEDVFMLEAHDKLDLPTMKKMLAAGYSRIPVYRKNKENIMGMLIVKELLTVSPKDSTPVMDLTIHRLPVVSGDMLLYPLLRLFSAGQSHMAIVVCPVNHLTVLGIITLEDVMEELIQQEIADETDHNDLNHDCGHGGAGGGGGHVWARAEVPPSLTSSSGAGEVPTMLVPGGAAEAHMGGLPGMPHSPGGMELSTAISMHPSRMSVGSLGNGAGYIPPATSPARRSVDFGRDLELVGGSGFSASYSGGSGPYLDRRASAQLIRGAMRNPHAAVRAQAPAAATNPIMMGIARHGSISGAGGGAPHNFGPAGARERNRRRQTLANAMRPNHRGGHSDNDSDDQDHNHHHSRPGNAHAGNVQERDNVSDHYNDDEPLLPHTGGKSIND